MSSLGQGLSAALKRLQDRKNNNYRRDTFAEKMSPEGPDGEIDRIYEILNSRLRAGGFFLDNDMRGEIIELSFAPNESLIISHGLKVIPKYRLILRQTGNAVITDVNSAWTDTTIGLLNNSAVAVTLTIKLFPR